jgi:hypothetical protein
MVLLSFCVGKKLYLEKVETGGPAGGHWKNLESHNDGDRIKGGERPQDSGSLLKVKPTALVTDLRIRM